MLSLCSINVEGIKHHERVLDFISKHNPTIICLQEVTEALLAKLREHNYLTAFMPMCKKRYGVIGVAIASQYPFETWTQYYHKAGSTVPTYDHMQKAETEWFGYLTGKIAVNQKMYTIITTHFWDTNDGHTDDTQRRLMSSLLMRLSKEQPHILCGDFNIPRHHNELYETLTEHYRDNIPPHYQSSLDRNLHRLGNMKIDQPIFDKYMVDYIFTTPSYLATDVALHFGVSDHAAVTATITTQQ